MSLAVVEKRPLSVDEFLQLARIGMIHEDERVELIDGEMWYMPPQDPGHATGITLVERHVRSALGDEYILRAQLPLRVDDWTLPEPDLCVTKGPLRRWQSAHPRGDDALLVVEIVNTARASARAKIANYAGGGVPEYWVVDVPARLVEIRTDPDREARHYRLTRLVRDGEAIAFAGATIAVTDLLPSP